MDGNDRDEGANPLPTLGGLLDLKDWLTLGEAAKVLARRLGDEVSEADVLRLGLDGRLVLSVRFVNGTDARRGRLVPENQATYSEVPSLDGQRTVRLYRGPQLDNGNVIELEEGIVALRGVFDLPMIGGELHTVEAEYQRRAVAEQAAWPPCVEVTDVAMDGAFVTDGASYFQLQGWLKGDGFNIRAGKDYRRPVPSPYPRGDLPEDAAVVVRPGPLRELLACMNAEAKPLRFVVPLRPREVPGDLLALPRDAPVQYVNSHICGQTGAGITKAGELVAMIRDTIARQNDGWLTIEEAAQILEDAGRGCAVGKGGWVEKLSFAARVGTLGMHQPVTLARIDYGPPFMGGGPSLRTFHEWAHVDELNRWLEVAEPRLPFRFDGPPKPVPNNAQAETTEQRQARRYQACIDAGITVPTNDYAHLPRGVGNLARKEGISRQAFTEDVKAHIRRLNGR
jgi:hypothetical protein